MSKKGLHLSGGFFFHFWPLRKLEPSMIQVLGLVQFGVVKWLRVFDDKVKV